MSLWWQSGKPSATLVEEHEHLPGAWLSGFSVALQKHHEWPA